MPPPIASFPHFRLSAAESLYLSRLRREIRLRSSRLLYIQDGGRFYFLARPRHHPRVMSRRSSKAKDARSRRLGFSSLPREYRALVRNRILGLRTLLLDGASLRTLSLRSSLPVSVLTHVLNGRRSDLPLSLAIRIADAAGVKVRTLATYLRRVRAIRRRALSSFSFSSH